MVKYLTSLHSSPINLPQRFYHGQHETAIQGGALPPPRQTILLALLRIHGLQQSTCQRANPKDLFTPRVSARAASAMQVHRPMTTRFIPPYLPLRHNTC